MKVDERGIEKNEKPEFNNNKDKRIRFYEKKFELRNSLLTDMIENDPHIKTIYNIFVALLISLFVSTIAHDYLRTKEIKFGFHLIYKGFGKLYISAISWVVMVTLTFIAYVLFNVWSKVRLTLFPKSYAIKLWDTFWICCLFCYYVVSFRATAKVVVGFRLPVASATIILLEQARLLMKVHSFVRTNAERIVTYKPHSDKNAPTTKFSKYLYFLFAPTLIYRDEYPRTKKIHWDFVLYRILDIAGIILLYSFILYRFIFPFFESFGERKYTKAEILAFLFDTTIPAMFLCLATFYLIMHAVQNLMAELLTFGDRQFYRDWWRSTTYQEYFKTWNILVYDWLYAYVFKDMCYLTNGNKTLAKVTVFVVSAVVHEWGLTYMFGFFLPILFLEFFVGGTMLYFLRTPKVTALNILFWYGHALGNTILLCMYTLEWHVRQNFPSEDTWSDYLIPRFLTCDCIH